MDYKEKLNDAVSQLQAAENAIYTQEANAIRMLKEILTPCGAHGCLVGTDDYADDIFYPWAEPTPGAFRRITAVRYLPGNDALEVRMELQPGEDSMTYVTDEDGWITLSRSGFGDIRFLLNEIRWNIEYSDGYQPEEEDEFEFIIDEDGSKYNPETSALSGGMDTRCDYNEEALYAYKVKKTLPEITSYLLGKGWALTHEKTYVEFRKGNTSCFFDDFRDEDGFRGYVCFGTEYKPGEEAPKEEEKPMKRYAVPFLRSQWADVYVDATSPEEAIEKAEAVFNEGHDGWIDWEDIDCPEYDEARGVEEQK